MAGFITDQEKSGLAILLNQTFQTFQRDQNIVVWKEPIKQALPSASTSQGGFGFGDAPLENQYIYTPVSGVFPAVIRYLSNGNRIGKAISLEDTNAFIPVGDVKIKVGAECYNFIEDGKTEKISFDNQDFYFVGKSQASPFMGTNYWFYQLKPLP